MKASRIWHLLAPLVALASLSTSASSGNCNPTVTLTGQPCLNRQVTLTMGGHLDCKGCLVGSQQFGPTQVGMQSIPVGLPADAFIVGFGGDSLTFTIPNDPALFDTTWYFAAVLSDGSTLDTSSRFQVVICQ